MIEKYFESFGFLTEDEINDVVSKTTKRSLPKSNFFIKEGQSCNEVAFVLSGLLRSFYVSDKGDEFTYCITFPNNFMTAYSSLITEQITVENIQAITDTELLIISKQTIDKLAAENQNWMRFQKIIAEFQYLELENRIFQLQQNNAEQRYIALIENQPKYIQNIPLLYLASYLGVSQRHLSRIRKRISF